MSQENVQRAPTGDEAAGRAGVTVERVAADLKAGILEGRFAPGQRLISRDIVDQFGVSRSSLREAFRRLEADGLVDVVPNRGAVVRMLSAEQVRHVFQIREALEGYAARMAAQRIDQGDNRQALMRVVQAGRQNREPPRFLEFVANNRAFHQWIAGCCGNPTLCELVDKHQLPVFMIQLRQIITMETVINNALDEHEAIAAAILAGDADAAYEAMTHHLWHSADQILALRGLVRPPGGGADDRD